jgi:hypothetical protein
MGSIVQAVRARVWEPRGRVRSGVLKREWRAARLSGCARAVNDTCVRCHFLRSLEGLVGILADALRGRDVAELHFIVPLLFTVSVAVPRSPTGGGLRTCGTVRALARCDSAGAVPTACAPAPASAHTSPRNIRAMTEPWYALRPPEGRVPPVSGAPGAPGASVSSSSESDSESARPGAGSSAGSAMAAGRVRSRGQRGAAVQLSSQPGPGLARPPAATSQTGLRRCQYWRLFPA